MKKKPLITVIFLFIAVPTILVLKPLTKKEATFSFETTKVKRGNMTSTVTATGTIEAIITVKVGTQVSGILKRVYADFNDVVKKGQLLAKLDETSLKAQLEQSQSQVDQAQAQYNYNESTYKRLKVLFEKNLISQAEYDLAFYNYENSKAAVVSASSNLARSRVNLDYATITSPIDGVVLNRAVEEGQTVAASFNTPELFTIVNDLTQMEVQTSVDEADIGKVKQNQRVEFSVDAYPNMKFEGRVSEVRLQPVTTNNVVTYDVILSAPNPEKKLMPGMTASATIYVEEKTDALIISSKALRFNPDEAYLKKMFSKTMGNMAQPSGNLASRPSGAPMGFPDRIGPQMSGQSMAGRKTVWIKDEKSGLRPNHLETGIDNGTTVEILNGLKEGDEVVIAMSGGNKAKSTSAQRNGGPGGPGGPFPF